MGSSPKHSHNVAASHQHTSRDATSTVRLHGPPNETKTSKESRTSIGDGGGRSDERRRWGEGGSGRRRVDWLKYENKWTSGEEGGRRIGYLSFWMTFPSVSAAQTPARLPARPAEPWLVYNLPLSLIAINFHDWAKWSLPLPRQNPSLNKRSFIYGNLSLSLC